MKIIENVHLVVFGNSDSPGPICELHGDLDGKSFDITIGNQKINLMDFGCSPEDIDALINGLQKFKQKMFPEG
jgi:hypothetical protein